MRASVHHLPLLLLLVFQLNRHQSVVHLCDLPPHVLQLLVHRHPGVGLARLAPSRPRPLLRLQTCAPLQPAPPRPARQRPTRQILWCGGGGVIVRNGRVPELDRPAASYR